MLQVRWTVALVLLSMFLPPFRVKDITAEDETDFSQRVATRDGRFGQALDIAKTPLRARSLPAYNTVPLTVQFWMQIPRGKSRSLNHLLLSNASDESSTHWEILTTARYGELTARVGSQRTLLLNSFRKVADGRWHFVTLTNDGQLAKLFLDGQPVGQTLLTEERTAPPATAEFFLGSEDEAKADAKPTLLDDVHFSNTIRDGSLVPTKPQTADEHTVALWRFDEVEGNTARDLSGGSNPLAYSPGIEAAWTPRSSNRPDAPAWELETDADWNDDRFNRMDTGGMLGCTMELPPTFGHAVRTIAPKGLALRIGDEGEAGVLFDRGRLQLSGFWTGDFLTIPPRRFGLIQWPTPAGTLQFSNISRPGWLANGKSADYPEWSPLPAEWGRYRGVYRHGNRAVLHYDVHGVRVLEHPWLVKANGQAILTRTFNLAADEEPLVLDLFRTKSVRLSNEGTVKLASATDGKRQIDFLVNDSEDSLKFVGKGGSVQLVIPPRTKPLSFTLYTHTGKVEEPTSLIEFVSTQSEPTGLEAFTRGGPSRFPHRIETEVTSRREPGSPFVLEELTLPFENPYNAIFYMTGVCFRPDGELVVSSIYGDVWTAREESKGETVEWKRIASGMYQPLGMVQDDEGLLVLERGQITRLRDLDGDGETDYYENFYNGWQTTGAGHAYDTGLKRDPEGNLFLFKGQVSSGTPCDESGCLLKVAADGSGHEVYSTGFRHPIGLGMSADGIVTGADQQGNWMPATRIDRYRKGGFYGDMRVHHREVAPETYDPPICWLPQDVDNSAGGQVFVPEGVWGPLGGGTLHLSWGRCRVYSLLGDLTAPIAQGGVVPLPIPITKSGPLTGKFHPETGDLYLVGLHGWQTAAEWDGCVERIRYAPADAKNLTIPKGFQTASNTLTVTFTDPIDGATAMEVKNWSAEMWNYRWSASYGSDHWSVAEPDVKGHDPVRVEKVDVSDDGKVVRLTIPGLKPVMQFRLGYRLKDAEERPIDNVMHLTIHEVNE